MRTRTKAPQTEHHPWALATITMRLPPDTVFAAWFGAMARRQTRTAFYESAIQALADTARIGDKTWRDFFDASEAVTNLRIIADQRIPLERHELDRRSFVLAHPECFFDGGLGGSINRARAEALWPKIDEYVAHWFRTRSTDAQATTEILGEHCRKARVPLHA